MPRYEYKCDTCQQISAFNHLSTEQMDDCPLCTAQSSLKKILSTFSTSRNSHAGSVRVGEITEQFIKDARVDLKKQKETP